MVCVLPDAANTAGQTLALLPAAYESVVLLSAVLCLSPTVGFAAGGGCCCPIADQGLPLVSAAAALLPGITAGLGLHHLSARVCCWCLSLVLAWSSAITEHVLPSQHLHEMCN